jgi:hypothetical protein
VITRPWIQLAAESKCLLSDFSACGIDLYVQPVIFKKKTPGNSAADKPNIAIHTMPPEITIKKNYILIEPKAGIDLREIQQGVARLFYVKEIPKQNRIWIFREGPQNLSYDDLPRLKDIIKENYPENSKINKTALVVESEAQSDLALAFTKIAEDLPQTFKVFFSLADAEEWIKQ